MQTKPAFQAAIKSFKDAGIEIVDMDMSLLEGLANDMTPPMMFFTHEMPREVSRYWSQGRRVARLPLDSCIIRHCEALTHCMHHDCLLSEVFLTLRKVAALVCRYVYQHGYNLSLAELVDKIASPTVRSSMMEWTYKKLDSFPTPIDYAEGLATGMTRPLSHSQLQLIPTFARADSS